MAQKLRLTNGRPEHGILRRDIITKGDQPRSTGHENISSFKRISHIVEVLVFASEALKMLQKLRIYIFEDSSAGRTVTGVKWGVDLTGVLLCVTQI